MREHVKDSDAQAVYSKLITHHRNSSTSKIEVSNLQRNIVTLVLDDNSWKGTKKGFLLHWQEQLRKLHELLPVKDHYHDGLRKSLLQCAVTNIEELRSVSTIKMNSVAAGQSELTYAQYLSLVGSAATALDNIRLTP